MNTISSLLQALFSGDIQALSRCISLAENESAGYEELLAQLPHSNKIIVGITGAPGAGKSTLADGLIDEMIQQKKRVAVLCIDPSSPFSRGALLGDRLRMNAWYNNPNVYIRSVASRGSLGGLCPSVLEITDLLKAAPYDYIIIETVGIGQNEIEIASLADITVVVYVPEAGDDVQAMKAGIIEIADIFVVNKADRQGAELFATNLQTMLAHQPHEKKINVIKTIATEKKGTAFLFEEIQKQAKMVQMPERRIALLAQKAYQLIQRSKMKNINKKTLEEALQKAYEKDNFNLYQFVKEFSGS